MKRKIFAAILMLATALFFTACDTGTGDIAAPDIAAIAAIGGVTPPATGGIPVTVVTETDQYRGTVSWSDSPETFACSKAYTATITLTAKAGYSEIGVPANFFTVAGAFLVSNNADSGIVKAVFPETEPGTVTYSVGGGNSSGTVPVDPAVYNTGDSVTVLDNNGSLSGELITGTIHKGFLGWDINSSVTIPQYKAGDTFTLNSDIITLYAIYSALRVTGPAGGLIFYDAGSTQSWGRYLEAAPDDITPGTGYQWKTSIDSTPGTSLAIGSGAENTIAMAGSEHPAAQACRDYSTPGFSAGSWFLPSKDELWQMCWNLHGVKYETVSVLNPDVPVAVGGFAGNYWSSSEGIHLGAWAQFFPNGSQANSNKDYRAFVRAVRAF